MRLNYAEDEDFPGQFELWQANCRRSLNGKVGQRELRVFEAALLALPEKRLIYGQLHDGQGGVCAISCYAKYKGLDISAYDAEDESSEVGMAVGMPRLVAWTVVELNDIDCKYMTPEERYVAALTWVQQQLTKA